MAILHPGGTIRDITFTASNRAAIVSELETRLGEAGWSTVSGGSSSNVVMRSVATPSGHSIDVRLNDPGSGNCAQIFLRNAAATLESQAHFLLPGGSTYYLRAYRYGFETWAETLARKFCFVCVPYLPSARMVAAITGADFGAIGGNAVSDSETTLRNSFLSAPGFHVGRWATLVNGSLQNVSGNGSTGGQLGIVQSVFAEGSSVTVIKGTQWADGSWVVVPVTLGWNQTDVSAAAVRYGLMWGALWTAEKRAKNSTFDFDGKTYRVITDTFNGVSSANQQGCLCVVTN